MKKTDSLLLFLLAFVLSFTNIFAQDIVPVGEKVGHDKASNAIYTTEVNGVSIGYKLVGSGEPLVMILGLGATMDAWPQEIVNLLSQKYQLIIFDNRGMGYSSANEVAFSYKLFASDVLSLMDALGIEKSHVLGFSMGSVITQNLLLDAPHRFEKAILYASSTSGLEVTKNLSAKLPDNSIIQRQFEASKSWLTPLDKLALVKNDVMLIVGTSDSIVGTQPTKIMANAIVGAWMVQFKNADHLLMREAPIRFAKTVLLFLQNDTNI